MTEPLPARETPAPVVYFEILGGEGTRHELREFYARSFGWQYQVAEQWDYAAVARDEGTPGIGGAVHEAPDGPRVVLSIEVEDVRAALDVVLANGAELVQEIVVVPGIVTYAQFRDPASNVLTLSARATPDAD